MWNNIKLVAGLTVALTPSIAALVGGSYLLYLYLSSLYAALDFWTKTAITF